MARSRPYGGPARILLDAVLLVWVVWWLWAGIAVGHEVRRLAGVSDTAGRLGQAVIGMSDVVRGLPLVGGQLGGSVRAAGEDAVASARSTRTTTRRLGLLLGAAIAVIPDLPLLLLYLPSRLAAERDRRALLRAVADGPADRLDELLARRAVAHLPYRRLLRISTDPAGDVLAGRHTALADAELDWYGVRRAAR